jgi:dipeptidyl aminopeptidase/acylaminoacyl peptidase
MPRDEAVRELRDAAPYLDLNHQQLGGALQASEAGMPECSQDDFDAYLDSQRSDDPTLRLSSPYQGECYMRLVLLATTALIAAAPLAAQIVTPDRPLTDPKSLTSLANAGARVIPVEDLITSRVLADAKWSADGRHIFVATNLTGRVNIWRTDVDGSWPIQLTQSDDVQTGLTATTDGRTLLFTQDQGGNEYPDVYAVAVDGGVVMNLTKTPDVQEGALLAGGADGRIALSTKRKSQGQSNLAVMETSGQVRTLTSEPDAQFGWTPAAWVDGGRAIIANRRRVDSVVVEVWKIDAASGTATLLLGKADTVYTATDATRDGRSIAVSTNDGAAQLHAGLYDLAEKHWRWLKPTPWEQTAGQFSPDGKTLVVRNNADARTTLLRVDTATLAEAPLSLPPGVNSLAATPAFNKDGSKLLVVHSGADSPPELLILDVASGRTRRATQLAMASLKPEALPKSEVVSFTSFDGTLLSAVVTLPYNLKRDGSHPGIVLPHGGPTSQSLDGFSRTAAALASRGYMVIQPNFRGSTGYGRAFQRANFKDLGGGDLKDTLAAKRFMVATGYVDRRRVGITGGSYGGFLTLMAVGRMPDEFAAAVQSYGIINWRTMYRDQDERLKAYQRSLIGTPEAEPAVYDAASPLTYLPAAKAPLLSLQGENDVRVPRGQAVEVAAVLKAKGTLVETVFYAAEGHGFQKRENQLDALKRTVEWFDRHLKQRTPTN